MTKMAGVTQAKPPFAKNTVFATVKEGLGTLSLSFILLCSFYLSGSWMQKKSPSGAKDKNAPQLAPFYWGIKELMLANRESNTDIERHERYCGCVCGHTSPGPRVPRIGQTSRRV